MPISPTAIVLKPNAGRVHSETNAIDNQFGHTDWVLENKKSGEGMKAGLWYWNWTFEQDMLNSIDLEEIKKLYKEAGWTEVEVILQPGFDRPSLRLYTDKHVC